MDRTWKRGSVGRPYSDPRGPLVTVTSTERHRSGEGWIHGIVIGHMNPRPDFRHYASGDRISWWGAVA